jgi:hypothetical protein
MIERTWPDLDSYVAVHAAANSLLSAGDPLLRDYLGHFPAEGRVRLNPDAVGRRRLGRVPRPVALAGLAVPTWLVHAEWSVDRDSAPACSPEAAAAFQAALPCLAPPRLVTGVCHGGLLWTKTGADAVVAVPAEVVEARSGLCSNTWATWCLPWSPRGPRASPRHGQLCRGRGVVHREDCGDDSGQRRHAPGRLGL